MLEVLLLGKGEAALPQVPVREYSTLTTLALHANYCTAAAYSATRGKAVRGYHPIGARFATRLREVTQLGLHVYYSTTTHEVNLVSTDTNINTPSIIFEGHNLGALFLSRTHKHSIGTQHRSLVDTCIPMYIHLKERRRSSQKA